MPLTDAQTEQIVASLAAGDSARTIANRLSIAHTTITRLLDRNPEIRRQVAKATRAARRRERDAERKAARKIRELNGVRPGQQPEHDDPLGIEARRRERNDTRTGRDRAFGGANRRKGRGNGGGRILAAQAGRSFAPYGNGVGPDWWLTAREQRVPINHGLVNLRRFGDDGRELERRSVEGREAEALLAAGWQRY